MRILTTEGVCSPVEYDAVVGAHSGVLLGGMTPGSTTLDC